MMKNRLLPASGAICWLLGLLLFIVGLNLHIAAGSWLTVIGSLLFLVGLGLEGIVWFRRSRSSDRDPAE